MTTLEQHFDACFCINLKRRSDRRAECLREIEEHFGTQPGFVEFWDGYDHPTHGHSGCTRSHRELLRHIASKGCNRVLVLEDDFAVVTLDRLRAAKFHPGSQVWETHCRINNGNGNLNERFGALSYFIPDDYDVIYLGAGYGENPISRLNKHVIRCGFMQTTSSYGITGAFAKKWTETVDAQTDGDLERHPGPIDNVFGSMSHDHKYYVFQPRLMYQRESMSNITDRVDSYLYSMTDPNHENLV